MAGAGRGYIGAPQDIAALNVRVTDMETKLSGLTTQISSDMTALDRRVTTLQTNALAAVQTSGRAKTSAEVATNMAAEAYDIASRVAKDFEAFQMASMQQIKDIAEKLSGLTDQIGRDMNKESERISTLELMFSQLKK